MPCFLKTGCPALVLIATDPLSLAGNSTYPLGRSKGDQVSVQHILYLHLLHLVTRTLRTVEAIAIRLEAYERNKKLLVTRTDIFCTTQYT